MIDTNTKWFFTDKESVRTEMALEQWAWRVTYKDETELYQYEMDVDANNEAVYHQIGEIDMDNVQIFEMINTSDVNKRFSVIKSDEMKSLIHLYRRIHLNVGTQAETNLTIYIFGYVIGTTSVYNFILPDGRLITSTDRNTPLITQ